MFNFNLSIKMSTRKRFSLKLIKLMITVAISVAASLGLVRSNVDFFCPLYDVMIPSFLYSSSLSFLFWIFSFLSLYTVLFLHIAFKIFFPFSGLIFFVFMASQSFSYSLISCCFHSFMQYLGTGILYVSSWYVQFCFSNSFLFLVQRFFLCLYSVHYMVLS